MISPTVHLNGTSREELDKQYRHAVEMLDDAITALPAPNGRDYYPQGQQIINQAMLQRQEWLLKLSAVKADLFKIWEGLQP